MGGIFFPLGDEARPSSAEMSLHWGGVGSRCDRARKPENASVGAETVDGLLVWGYT